jgi:hypothetical protein
MGWSSVVAAWRRLATVTSDASLGVVNALAVFDDGGGPALYVGGYFSTAGGGIVNGIAEWNGAAWTALGDGIRSSVSPAYVYALAAFDDGTGPTLYAGGRFTTAGDVDAVGIARWDGTRWSAVGSGMGTDARTVQVRALVVHDDENGPALYAGGGFATAGGVTVNSVAKWNGVEWSPLGSGVEGAVADRSYYGMPVFALSAFTDSGGPSLYAGGAFRVVGGEVSAFLARWGCRTVLADLDVDGDVDLGDFGHLQACFNGPNQPPAWMYCDDADVDGDGDVDMVDFLRFQACFNGPNRAPACE